MRLAGGWLAVFAIVALLLWMKSSGNPSLAVAGGSVPAQQTRTYMPLGTNNAYAIATATPTPTAAALSTQLPANPTGTVTVSGSNGAVTLLLPPGVVQVGGQNVAVTLGINPATPPSKSGSSGVGIKAFDITMKTPDGQSVSQLSQPMRIEFTYDDQELAANGVDASSLVISSSSDGGATWQDLTTGVDTTNHIVFADVSHLTRFNMGGGGSPPNSTKTATATSTITPTRTNTPSSTATNTPTKTPTPANTSTPTPSQTRTFTPTNTPSNTPTNTPTATPTITNTPGSTSTPTPTSTSTGVALISSWKINTTAVSTVLGSGYTTDVQGITVTAAAGKPEVMMVSKGIPSYSQTMTSNTIATLTARPEATRDLPNGVKVAAGTPVAFGQDIGYSSTTCTTPTPGAGYWARGPVCPATRAPTPQIFPLTPSAAATKTPTTKGGTVGYWVNGVAVFAYGDGQYYDSTNKLWARLAGVFEKYDMDIDNGHANSAGVYHHHFYSPTLAAQLGDNGTGHSPIYGFAADGYPIYGPWYASGVLAQSGWATRDYDTPSALTGCGTAHKRTCVMNDQTNKNGGTSTATTAGPDTNTSGTTANGNPVSYASGAFAEDYYYDSSNCTVAAACLDQYNGHDHDGLGYHYHLTVSDSTNFTPAFPYVVGMSFYGSLPSGSFYHGAERGGMWAP